MLLEKQEEIGEMVWGGKGKKVEGVKGVKRVKGVIGYWIF